MASADEINEALNSHNHPLSAQFLAKKLNPVKTKKEVNSRLYKMEKDGLVEKLEMSPILWRLVEKLDY